MKTGRPLKYKTVKELEEAIDGYFNLCEQKKKPLTMSGLAFALGIDRKTLVNYAHRDEFFPAIKRARACVEVYLEELAYTAEGNVKGILFGLKNNFAWTDKTEQDVNINSYSLFERETEKKAQQYVAKHTKRDAQGNGK